MIRLIFQKGGPVGTAFDLDEGEHLLGRGHKCSIRLTAADVSREHVHLTVAGSKATVENLSQYGTRLDGPPVEGKAEVRDGQTLYIGKQTVLKIALNVSAAPLARGDVTMGGGAGQSAAQASGQGGMPSAVTRPPPSLGVAGTLDTRAPGSIMGGTMRPVECDGAQRHGDDAPSSGTWLREPGGEAHTGGGTRAQMTRGVPPEVIEETRRWIREKEKRRVILVSAILVLALALIVAIAYILRPKVEKEILWPSDEKCQPMKRYEAGVNGGRKDDGYDVVFPGGPDVKVERSDVAIVIRCSIGRKRDVPMHIVVREEVDDSIVTQSVGTVVAQWCERMAASDGRYVFDKPLPKVLFLGSDLKENGIPFQYVPFESSHDNKGWFGAAYVFCNGRHLVAATVELPASERVRAENLLFNFYIEPAHDYVRSHWEGGAEVSRVSAIENLARIRQELRRQAPGTWGSIRLTIRGVLQKAILDHDVQAEKEALDLLRQLRSQEARWYNNQAIQIAIAKTSGEMGRVRQLADEAQGVFTSKDDWRFYECRRW